MKDEFEEKKSMDCNQMIIIKTCLQNVGIKQKVMYLAQ